MVLQDDFQVEHFMDKYETDTKCNMGGTCVDSLSIQDLKGLVDSMDAKNVEHKLSKEGSFGTKLT